VQAYGDHGLAMFIGDESSFAAVGAHSWEAFCDDCGYGVKPTLTLFKKMAKDVRQSWNETVATALSQYPLSPAEKALIERMGVVIQTNSQAALSMSAS
jgi:serine/threonine-protein kinase HipA